MGFAVLEGVPPRFEGGRARSFGEIAHAKSAPCLGVEVGVDYTRLLLPHEVEAMASTLWALGLMDWKGRPLRPRRPPWEAGGEEHEEGAFTA